MVTDQAQLSRTSLPASHMSSHMTSHMTSRKNLPALLPLPQRPRPLPQRLRPFPEDRLSGRRPDVMKCEVKLGGSGRHGDRLTSSESSSGGRALGKQNRIRIRINITGSGSGSKEPDQDQDQQNRIKVAGKLTRPPSTMECSPPPSAGPRPAKQAHLNPPCSTLTPP